jgi:hypothetical protein
MADEKDLSASSKTARAPAQRDAERESRLAAALRKNLRRRKAAGRAGPAKGEAGES